MNNICKKLWSRLTQQERKELYRNYDTKKDLSVKLMMPSNFSLIEAVRLSRVTISKDQKIQVSFLQFADDKENRFVMIADPYQLEHIHKTIGEMLKDIEILQEIKTISGDLNKNTPIN